VNFLIVPVSFTVVGIPNADLSDRLGVALTCMLTAMAFKFVLMQMLPVVSYLTLLDVYVLSSFFFLGIVAAECFLARWFVTYIFHFELIFYSMVTLIWVTTHIALVAGMRYGWFVESVDHVKATQTDSQWLALETRRDAASGWKTLQQHVRSAVKGVGGKLAREPDEDGDESLETSSNDSSKCSLPPRQLKFSRRRDAASRWKTLRHMWLAAKGVGRQANGSNEDGDEDLENPCDELPKRCLSSTQSMESSESTEAGCGDQLDTGNTEDNSSSFRSSHGDMHACV